MNGLDLVREYIPDADDEKCDFILWNLTAFPFVEIDKLREQLQHVKDIGVEAAVEEAEREYSEVCRSIPKRKEGEAE